MAYKIYKHNKNFTLSRLSIRAMRETVSKTYFQYNKD